MPTETRSRENAPPATGHTCTTRRNRRWLGIIWRPPRHDRTRTQPHTHKTEPPRPDVSRADPHARPARAKRSVAANVVLRRRAAAQLDPPARCQQMRALPRQPSRARRATQMPWRARTGRRDCASRHAHVEQRQKRQLAMGSAPSGLDEGDQTRTREHAYTRTRAYACPLPISPELRSPPQHASARSGECAPAASRSLSPCGSFCRAPTRRSCGCAGCAGGRMCWRPCGSAAAPSQSCARAKGRPVSEHLHIPPVPAPSIRPAPQSIPSSPKRGALRPA